MTLEGQNKLKKIKK